MQSFAQWGRNIDRRAFGVPKQPDTRRIVIVMSISGVVIVVSFAVPMVGLVAVLLGLSLTVVQWCVRAARNR